MANFDDYTGLQLWLEADSGITVSDGDAMGETGGPLGDPGNTWNDAGPVEGTTDDIFGDVLSADPYRYNPTYKTSQLNGFPAVRFIQDDDHDNEVFTNHRLFMERTMSDPQATGLISEAEFSIFVLFRVNTWGTGDFDDFDVGGSAGGHPDVGFTIANSGGQHFLRGHNEEAGGGFQTLEWPIETGVWYLAELWHDGSTLYGLLNGCEPQSIASGLTYNTSTSIFNLSPRSGTDNTLEIDVVLVVFYDEERSQSERDLLRAAVATKYALTFGACLTASECVPTEGLTIYLDSTRVEGFSDGDIVFNWQEAGPIENVHPNDVIQIDDPAWGPNYRILDGGCSVLRFEATDALNKYLDANVRKFFDPVNTDRTVLSDTGFTIVTMARLCLGHTTTSDNSFYFYFTSGPSATFYAEISNIFDDSPTYHVHFQWNSDSIFDMVDFVWDDAPYTPGTWALLTIRWDGATVTGSLNRTTPKTQSVSAFDSELTSGITIGYPSFDDLNSDRNAEMGYLLSYNRYLDDDELNDLLDCLEEQCLGPGGGSGSMSMTPDPLALVLLFPTPDLHIAYATARRGGYVQILGIGV